MPHLMTDSTLSTPHRTKASKLKHGQSDPGGSRRKPTNERESARQANKAQSLVLLLLCHPSHFRPLPSLVRPSFSHDGSTLHHQIGGNRLCCQHSRLQGPVESGRCSVVTAYEDRVIHLIAQHLDEPLPQENDGNVKPSYGAPLIDNVERAPICSASASQWHAPLSR